MGRGIKTGGKAGVANMHVTLADERHYACATELLKVKNNTVLFKK